MSGPVYIVCGGTGGHLAPGIATAQRLMEADIDVKLIISEKEIDSRLLKGYPEIPYLRVVGAPFSLKPLPFLKFAWKTLRGFIQAVQTMRRERPVVVLAFGGFLSVSYVIAAWTLRIPILLHEANRVAGRSIRFLAGMADMVFLPEGVALSGVEPRRLRRLGMPLRRGIHHIPKDKVRKAMGIPFHDKVLVVAGGSQGAEILNTWIERHHKSLGADGIWVLIVTGPGKNKLPDVVSLTSDGGSPVETRSFAFHPNMHELFSCADLVVSRAGAGTIAELICCLAPSILIPYPFAADDHQLANARDLERRGGCVMISQENVKNLYREILDLIYNDWLLSRIRDNLRQLGHGDAAGQLAAYIARTYTDTGPSRSLAHGGLNPVRNAIDHE
jgi:UDP-N-acetylglucosamine--N-acetylmuramyl-(pentapeptide) pyrophosphoryl-undecaprenol N-acetylglucosamine transferase